MNPLNCPLTEGDFGKVYNYLIDLPLHKLIMLTMQVMSSLTPVEAMNYNINKFCQRYDDRRGRIAFLKKLVDDGIIMPLQYPYNALRDSHLRKMMSTAHYTMCFPFGKDEEAAEEACLTDDLEVVSGPVNVTNPRWEHKKEAEVEAKVKVEKEGEKKAEVEDKDAEKKASFGDTIILMADVTGMPEGAGITFDIFETSQDPPMRVDTARGKIQGGIGRGEWVVTDKSGKGEESKLAFEGIAKSKASVRCEIAVESTAEFEFTLYIAPEDPTTYDDKVVLKGIDSDYEQTRTITDDKVAGDGMLTVAFTDVKKGEKYTLIHNDGQEEHIIIEETVYNG
jgi:hypothetical protein